MHSDTRATRPFLAYLGFLWIVAGLLAACGLDAPARPEGWTEATHGKDAAPDYATVFSQDTVKRIDITISPADWQAMLDDMTDLAGEFGAGGGFGPPQELIDACVGKSELETCSFSMGGGQMQGFCTTNLGMLLCMPDELPGGTQACAGMAEGDACTLSLGGDEVLGKCIVSEQGDLTCNASSPGLSSGDLDILERNPVWVPCTLEFEEGTWHHVGIRFKGNATLKQSWADGTYKLPLKLDIDEFENLHPEISDQRFFGFKRLALANNAQDASYLRDKVAGDLFREGGVPAPRRAFYRVFADTGDGPVYFGLYTMAEVPARPMFLSQFGEVGGNLYKPQSDAATWRQGFEYNEESFPKKTNETEADWSDVERAVDALHASREDPARWRNNLEQAFDVRGFLKWLAINTVIQDWDTYGNMAHNYYLYGDPAQDGRLRWIPWDHNLSFGGMGLMEPLPLDMSSVDDAWPLIRFLMDDPVYREAYDGYVQEFADGVFAVGAVLGRLRAEHELITPYVVGDEGEQPGYTVLQSAAAFDASLDSLHDHVARRHEAVALTR